MVFSTCYDYWRCKPQGACSLYRPGCSSPTDLYQFEPLTGQGGNSAIETAASFTNHLMAALDKCSPQTLSQEEISSVFNKTQQQREGRVGSLIRAAHSRQRLECLETAKLRFIALYVFPYMPQSSLMKRWIKTYCPAVSLRMFPQPPNRPRTVPFYDEVDENVKPRASLGFGTYAVFVAVACVAFRALFNTNMTLPFSLTKA